MRGVVGGWSRAFPRDEITLRTQQRHASIVAVEAHRAGFRVNVSAYPAWARYHASAVTSIVARRGDYDAVLTQNFCPAFSRVRTAVLLHDVLFITNPDWFTRTERLYLGAIRPSLRRADVILATSSSEAARIGTVWPEVQDRIERVGLAVPETIVATTARRPRSWRCDEPFILAVGRLNVRKNLARLIEAFALVAAGERHVHLVIAGERNGAYLPVEVPARIASRIHFLGHVSDSELRWLYEQCELFVFPSLGEGYGLPLVEANLLGARIVASDIPAFRELGVAVRYFDPKSVDDIAAAILSGLAAPAVVKSEQLTWDDVARNMRDALEGIPERRLGTGRYRFSLRRSGRRDSSGK